MQIELTQEEAQLIVNILGKVDPTGLMQPLMELRDKIVKQANAQLAQARTPVEADD
jgi:hypothetical protein